MIEINGSRKSGSGTILRLSIALAAITGQPLYIYNIRKNRPQPGLKPQHLAAVLTAAKLCDAELKNVRLDSRELWFNPKKVKSGKFEAEIGTAGSISMVLATMLPICTFAKDNVYLHVSKGGTDVQHSPTINYMRYVFLPTLKRMGLNCDLIVHRYGYYPKGLGEVTLIVEPCKSMKPLCLGSFGKITDVKGVSVCTFLAKRKVAERQAKAASKYLKGKGYTAEIRVVYDKSNPMQKGSSLILWAETDTSAVLAADAIGELGKTSEIVGREAAEKLHAEISAKATVDVHLSDLLIPYVALAQEESEFLTRIVSDHLETNIWLAEKMLDVKFNVKKVGKLHKVEKIG